jgi:hypothetical protein
MARVSGLACRINGLHDDVLLFVLSHLDAVELVHTSLLSRRWRGLWRSVPRINTQRDHFNGVADTERECDAMFKAFVSRFLMLRNPTPLDVFNLVRYSLPDDEFEAVDFDAESEDANLWIAHALHCNARSIDVSVWNGMLILDCSVFASTCYLNSLELSTVALTPGFFKNLQKGCAALEHLSLYNCCIYDVDICSQTLKVFTIGYECVFQFMERGTISISSLVYLGYFSCYRILPLLFNMESLETSSVSLRTGNTMVDDIYQVLRSLSGVANLNFRYNAKPSV